MQQVVASTLLDPPSSKSVPGWLLEGIRALPEKVLCAPRDSLLSGPLSPQLFVEGQAV